MKKKYSGLLIGAVTGIAIATASPEARAELLNGVDKPIICKREKIVDPRLRIQGCTYDKYPLAPPTAPNLNPSEDPPDGGGGYVS